MTVQAGGTDCRRLGEVDDEGEPLLPTVPHSNRSAQLAALEIANDSDDLWQRTQLKHAVASTVIGCILEAYDFLVFVYLGHVIKRLFFPASDAVTQNFAFYGLFAAGFLVRPLGAVACGWLGDRHGRKAVLQLTVWTVSATTFLMGCLPTYPQVGLAAPILLIILRLLQGVGKGGEVGGSIVFLVEHAPPRQRGLYSSLAPACTLLGTLVGCVVSLVLLAVLSPTQMDAWGWRLPFWLSVLGAALGIYVRQHVEEPRSWTEAVQQQQQHGTRMVVIKASTAAPRDGDEDDESAALIASASHLCMHHAAVPADGLPIPSSETSPGSALTGILILMLVDLTDAYGFYLTFTFLVNFFIDFAGLSPHASLLINSLNMLLYIAATPVGGWLSDIYGRVPVMMAPALLCTAFSYPVWCLFKLKNSGWSWLGQALLSVNMGFFNGARPAAMCEMFAVDERCRGVSIGHTLCMSVFGSTAGVLATLIIRVSGDIAAPALLMEMPFGSTGNRPGWPLRCDDESGEMQFSTKLASQTMKESKNERILHCEAWLYECAQHQGRLVLASLCAPNLQKFIRTCTVCSGMVTYLYKPNLCVSGPG